MDVDVLTDIEIERPRAEVADFVSNPDNATAWYVNIKNVEWNSPKPLGVGSMVSFEAQFMGRRIAYTYQVKEFVPGERPSGFSNVVAPVMAGAMRRANRKDLLA